MTRTWPEEEQAAVDNGTLIKLSATATDSSGVLVTMGNLSFLPEAGCTYFVEVSGAFRAAANTTGIEYLIDPGNGTGGWLGRTRGANSASSAVLYGSMDGSSVVAGTTSATTPGNKTAFEGLAFVKAHASAPTACSLKFRTEVGGSACTVDAGDAMLRYTKTKAA